MTPFGYLIVFSCGEQVVELHALMSANWSPRWSLEVYADDRLGTVGFTPSYVQAGSATAVIRSAMSGRCSSVRSTTTGTAASGGTCTTSPTASASLPPSDLVADLTFALDLSAGARPPLLGAMHRLASR